jgi:hypothetical protein
MSDNAVRVPANAARLLERGKVPFPEALTFLGIGRTLGYPMAKRYMRRIAKLTAQSAFDVAELRPRRDPKTGAWREVPCYVIGSKHIAPADLIVPMVYMEISWPF